MNCRETEKLFSPYLDSGLGGDSRAALDAHLRTCPGCRERLEETRSLVRGLSLLRRTPTPHGLAAAINDAISVERAEQATRASRPVGVRFAQWLDVHLMPYTVGALASLLLFVGVLSALRSPMTVLRDLADADRTPTSIVWVGGDEGGYDVTKPISPAGFVATRTGFSVESPSLNPRGALAALAWSPPTGDPGDDDMVVVADVYGNGRASLAAVMEPPRNPRMLGELEDALRKNPAFVPATLDRRPQTMRVVFVLQKMNVQEISY